MPAGQPSYAREGKAYLWHLFVSPQHAAQTALQLYNALSCHSSRLIFSQHHTARPLHEAVMYFLYLRRATALLQGKYRVPDCLKKISPYEVEGLID